MHRTPGLDRFHPACEARPKVGGNRIAISAEREHGAGLRVGEDAGEAGGIRRKHACRLDVDRSVALEDRRLRTMTEQREHRHRDQNAGTDSAAEVGLVRMVGWHYSVDEKVAEDIRPQLREGARLGWGLQVSGDLRHPVVDRLGGCRRQMGGEPGHAIEAGLERQLACVARGPVPQFDGLGMRPLAQHASLAVEPAKAEFLGERECRLFTWSAGLHRQRVGMVDDRLRVTVADVAVAEGAMVPGSSCSSERLSSTRFSAVRSASRRAAASSLTRERRATAWVRQRRTMNGSGGISGAVASLHARAWSMTAASRAMARATSRSASTASSMSSPIVSRQLAVSDAVPECWGSAEGESDRESGRESGPDSGARSSQLAAIAVSLIHTINTRPPTFAALPRQPADTGGREIFGAPVKEKSAGFRRVARSRRRDRTHAHPAWSHDSAR